MKWIKSLGVATTMALFAVTMLGQSPATGGQPQTPAPAGSPAGANPVQTSAPAAPARPMMRVSCPVISPAANPASFSWKHGPAEYHAYVDATKATTPAEQASLFAAFLQKYPDSDYRHAALEGEMMADSRSGQTAASVQAARRLLQSGVDAGTQLQAFYVIAGMLPSDLQLQTNLPLVAEAGDCGLKALQQVPRPASVPAAQFNAQKRAAQAIFERAIGFVEWHRKNYAAAIAPLSRAAQLNSTDPSTYYWLGVSQLYKQPPDFLGGIFSLARASDLAPSVGLITNYFRKAYTSYHGSANGMQDVLALAKTNTQPPAGFNIVSIATIRNQQNEAEYQKELQAYKNWLPPKNTFEGIEARLKRPDKARAMWDSIKGQGLDLTGIVIRSTPTTLLLAVGQAYQTKNQADVRIQLVIRHVVSRGDKVEVVGVPVSYLTRPHFLLVLNKGRIMVGARRASRRGRR